MKEFENHFTEGCILDVSCGDMKCRDCKRIAEYWWKAALEWIEESFDWTNNGSNLSILLKELEGE